MTEHADVVIVGGGPAGLAMAGAAARGGLKVVVFERSHYDQPRVGETLGAEVGPLLLELGAGSVFVPFLESQIPFTVIRSSFGTSELSERSSITHPLGSGWHVDRLLFDKTLAAWCASVGARICLGAGKCTVAKISSSYVVSCRCH